MEERAICHLAKGHSGLRAWPVQRPWGRTASGILQEQRGGPVAGAEQVRERRGEGEGREGTGRSCRTEDPALLRKCFGEFKQG